MKRSVDNLRCNENFSLDGLKSTRSSESEAEREEFDTEEAEVLSGSGKSQTRGGGRGGRGGSADRRIWPKIYSDFCKNSVRITDSKRNSNEPVIEPSITFLSKHNLSRCLYCTTLKLEHSNVLIIRVHSRAKL